MIIVIITIMAIIIISILLLLRLSLLWLRLHSEFKSAAFIILFRY